MAVEVEQHGMAALDPEVEVAVYYCCLEALQNVMKHAGARAPGSRSSCNGGQLLGQRRWPWSRSPGDRGQDRGPVAARRSAGGSRWDADGAERTFGGVIVHGSVPARAGSTLLEVAG